MTVRTSRRIGSWSGVRQRTTMRSVAVIHPVLPSRQSFGERCVAILRYGPTDPDSACRALRHPYSPPTQRPTAKPRGVQQTVVRSCVRQVSLTVQLHANHC